MQPAGMNRLELAAQARRDRQSQLEECISKMDLTALKETLKLVCMKQPSLLMDVLKSADGNGDPAPGNLRAVPNWCSCNNCREMPTGREKMCCGKIPENCHSRLADFYTIVLDELVLEVAMRCRSDALAEPRDNEYNRTHRHTAYRQYVMWMHGRLGSGNRKVIPSCCVWCIRDKYPEPSGQYVGYFEGILD